MLKTILASKIEGLSGKYSDNPAYPVRPTSQGEMFMNLVNDIYLWGNDNGFKIINIVNFNTKEGFELVVVYE